MRTQADKSAGPNSSAPLQKKKWERPAIVHAQIAKVTRGGINMMTDPLDITMMMS